jgi:alkanesulfonate monooxygenase SsuD/methylene tetrahydromethanopterin reductase-like flavin-dependent oxidoreductase (luciferase family)
MKKGALSIPLYPQKTPYSKILDEINKNIKLCEECNLDEFYFGEHLTDLHEKITSSLMMVGIFGNVTKNIKLGTLTSNLNFYKPSVLCGLISTADNISKGRLLLGIGSGSNMCDLESIGLHKKNNYKIMLGILNVIKRMLYEKGTQYIKEKNFIISTKKFGNKKLGLGFFPKLYNERNNLDIIMPALNPNSKNIIICAKNKWSVVISNFCSNDVIENHIESYLKFSPLSKKDALKKIKLSRFIFIAKTDDDANKFLDKEFSPYYQSMKIIYDKLNFFKKNLCFGKLDINCRNILKEISIYGSVKSVNEKINNIKKRYGDLDSLIYTLVPNSTLRIYNDSLKLFCKNIKT